MLRILVNFVLAVGLIAFGVHLLFAEAFALKGTVFSGITLYLFIICVFSLAGLAIAVLRASLSGTLESPPSLSDTYMDLANYRAAVIERFWPFIVVAIASLVLALAL